MADRPGKSADPYPVPGRVDQVQQGGRVWPFADRVLVAYLYEQAYENVSAACRRSS